MLDLLWHMSILLMNRRRKGGESAVESMSVILIMRTSVEHVVRRAAAGNASSLADRLQTLQQTT
jgi:hypothetical protein